MAAELTTLRVGIPAHLQPPSPLARETICGWEGGPCPPPEWEGVTLCSAETCGGPQPPRTLLPGPAAPRPIPRRWWVHRARPHPGGELRPPWPGEERLETPLGLGAEPGRKVPLTPQRAADKGAL